MILGKKTSEEITVPVTTLDTELEQVKEISLMKWDVQGYEAEVLDGAVDVLQRTKVLFTEITYVPYYQGDIQFSQLHPLITSRTPLRLWGISTPHCSKSGKPLWADAVYVNDHLLGDLS
jgi:hypothetical protein